MTERREPDHGAPAVGDDDLFARLHPAQVPAEVVLEIAHADLETRCRPRDEMPTSRRDVATYMSPMQLLATVSAVLTLRREWPPVMMTRWPGRSSTTSTSSIWRRATCAAGWRPLPPSASSSGRYRPPGAFSLPPGSRPASPTSNASVSATTNWHTWAASASTARPSTH